MSFKEFIYKETWKAKFRWRKIKSIPTLIKYNALKKFNLEGDDQLYYHLQRWLLRDMIRTPAEHEFLEAHGLLPEPEPEPEEPQVEPEPGLVREWDFLNLMLHPVTLNSMTYMTVEAKEYEDRICLKITRMDEALDAEDFEFSLPHQAGEQYVNFSMDGKLWRWGCEEGAIFPQESI